MIETFGFRENHSCNHALFILREIVASYQIKNKNTIVCAIDASKAFDKINRMKLLYKLKDKIDGKIWLILYKYYASSVAYINLNSESSPMFKTSLGVKQGGPLSPRLFCIYVDDLIKEIEQNELGSEVNGKKVGCLMYADDLLLISQKESEIQRMIEICEKFGAENEIKFIRDKTNLMILGPKRRNPKKLDLFFMGERLETTQDTKYLGVCVDGKITLKQHIEERR
jgi:retron-type reverse transcriptase